MPGFGESNRARSWYTERFMAGKLRKMLGVGEQAPSVTLHDGDGKAHSAASLAAKGPVLLAFFKISCPVCQLAFPFLNRLQGGEVRVVGVSQDDPEPTTEFVKRFSPGLTVLLDRYPYGASNQFGISSVPSLFQIEPDGRISYAWEGFSRDDMEQLGERAGMTVFQAGERVPVFRPG